MARIVLGVGSSHAPSLNGTVDRWAEAGKRDMANPKGGGMPMKLDIEAMIQERQTWIGKELTPEVWKRRHENCQKAIAQLGERLEQVAPDVVIILGDDTHEVFMPEDQIPAIGVFWGEQIRHVPHSSRIRTPTKEDFLTLKGEPALGRHIIGSLNGEGFDIASCRTVPEGRSIGHAFDFVYGRILKGVVPPQVPVLLNTYYAPNQPTLKRCYTLGKALRRAIESWEGDKTVAVIGSGGLSHMVIDEDLDRSVLEAMRTKDEKKLVSFPEEIFNWGTGEIRNWTVVAGAMEETDMEMHLLAYEPCYRSPAGTGCGCAFAYWE